MNYIETIQFLHQQLPMFSHVGGKAYHPGLERIEALLKTLQQPHQQYPIIHVAGTNGKGSVCHLLSAILQKAGYRVGLHTSPHLFDLRERIKVNGKLCSKKFVIDFTNKIKKQTDLTQPSFFELTVAMALDYFALKKVDIAIVEVGMGGRLDGTNIVHPILSIITNISFDHQAYLGNTLALIAKEKAGIIKKNVPVIIGETHVNTKHVFIQKANECHAPISFAQDYWKVTHFNSVKNKQVIDVCNIRAQQIDTYTIDMLGLYQTKNIITVLEAIHVLRDLGFHITNAIVKKACRVAQSTTQLKGRWYQIHDTPTTIVDVAHNVGGFKYIKEQLLQLHYSHIHIVLGFSSDKDVLSMLSLLPTQANYYFTQSNTERALNAYTLQRYAKKYHLMGDAYNNTRDALHMAYKKSKASDLILICGSFFLLNDMDTSFFVNFK